MIVATNMLRFILGIFSRSSLAVRSSSICHRRINILSEIITAIFIRMSEKDSLEFDSASWTETVCSLYKIRAGHASAAINYTDAT